MSEYCAEHGSFLIARVIAAPPQRVYAAFATAEGNARWCGAP